MLDAGCLPPMIPLHPPDTLQMPQHPGDHAWYAGDALEEYKPRDPLLLRHGVIR